MRESFDAPKGRRETVPHPLPLSDNRVQIMLARMAFSREHNGQAANGNEIMAEWNKEYAERYRKFVSAPEHLEEAVDPQDSTALERVLEDIRRGSDQTLH